MRNLHPVKPLYWVGSSKRDLLALPETVVHVFGYALYLAQTGKKHDQAKPLKGFGRQACWKLLKIGKGIHTAQFIRFALRSACLSYTYFRKNPSGVLRHPKGNWT